MSQGAAHPQLKRSHKTDFTTSAVPLVTRERSFIKPNKDPQKRRSHTLATIKGNNNNNNNNKPTLEIYRPPNTRASDINNSSMHINNAMLMGKLNVHAKEFTMNHHELHPSRSSSNIAMNFNEGAMPLQHSKSSGHIMRQQHHHHHHITHPNLIPILSAPLPLPLMHSTSSSHILNHLPRLNYHPHQFGGGAGEIMASHPVFSGHNQHNIHYPAANNNNNWMNNQHHQQQASTTNNVNNINSAPPNLKRSKSLGANETQSLAARLKDLAKADIDLAIFPVEDRANLKQAMDDPNQLPSRTVMDLVKTIMGKVVEGIRYCEANAKLCISIIEKEKNQTFLESLLNTCQQWYQERDKILRGIKAGDGTRFTAFMWFLTEMCGQLKRHQLKEQFETLQPELVLLSVLAKCCQACVSLPIKCLSETECLFFVLTSIGRDLETELPQQLEQLLANVRDGFLASAGSPGVRRTLLQLIELHASNWQLPGSSVLYYYPRIK